MRLRVRTLGSEECEVSVQPEETVLDLKRKIESQIPRMVADKQKLVHAGRVLDNSQLIKNYPQLKDNERLVVLVTKQVASSNPATAAVAPAATAAAAPAGAPAPPPAAASAATPAAPAANPGAAAARAAPAATADSSAAAAPAAPPAAAEQQQQQQQQGSSVMNESAAMLATGPQVEESVSRLVEMGFEAAMARAALRAAFNNPDRAVEYLMNGIPEDLVAADAVDTQQQQQQQEGAPGAPTAAAAAAAAAGDNPLAALRTHPTFLQVRQLVQANPQMLPQVLQMIGASNPDLLELITQNQESFLELLQERGPAAAGGPQGGAPGASREGGPSSLLQGGVVHLTEAEMEAVDRLTALGFTRMQVAEAYIACDRNEEMAANYLFENMNDFVEEAQEEPPASS